MSPSRAGRLLRAGLGRQVLRYVFICHWHGNKLIATKGRHAIKPSLDNIEIFPAGVLLKWSDGREDFIENRKLRDACPCAVCTGESDLFGRVSVGIKPLQTEQMYELVRVEPVGHYALQFFWGDGHNSGIYSLELLRSLSENEPPSSN